MKRLILCFFLLSSGLSSNALALLDCLDDESVKKSAEYWGYDPEAAVAFGRKIKKVVRQKDLKGLGALINGELQRGPRKVRFEQEEWSGVFGNKLWQVLLFPVDCTPVGWRGFMLGNGTIWYGFNGDGPDDKEGLWGVFVINDWIEHPDDKLDSVLWEADGAILHPDCFYLKWSSGDNYEELLEGTNCTDEEIGQCLEREDGIGLYKEAYGETLAINIVSCPKEPHAYEDGLFDEEMSREVSPESGFRSDREGRGFTWYRVVKILPLDLCKQLAPHITYACRGIRLVELHYNNGGTATWSYGNIYGLFSDTDSGHEIMVPLVNFRTLNEALNYIDGLIE
jgi:hypothetical protein